MGKKSLLIILMVLASFLILSQYVLGATQVAMSLPANQSKWNTTRATIELRFNSNASEGDTCNISIYRGSTSNTAKTLIAENHTLGSSWRYVWDISALADGTYWINVSINGTGTAGNYSSNVTGYVTVDSTDPTVASFSAPVNHVVQESSPMTVTYTPADTSGLERCFLYMSNHTAGGTYDGTYSLVEDDSSITSGSDNSFSVTFGRNDMVWYYVNCYDNYGNGPVSNSIWDNQLNFGGGWASTPAGGGGNVPGVEVPTAVSLDTAGVGVWLNSYWWIIVALVLAVVFNKPIRKMLKLR